MTTKNYYEILGVLPTADHNTIKSAYRRLARDLHPDRTGGDKAKKDKFKEISEA